ncbi:MAG: hypothetical protein H0W76_03935 [Pyrinomonadaceae bacterium]|nr:hypothetical protein [Pyrinomonadaceae bacterium]
MHRIRQTISMLLVFAMIGLGATAQATQRRAYRLTDREVERIIRRIEINADRFRSDLDSSLDQSRIDGTRREDNINNFIQEFESATNQLRSRFDNRTSVAADVEEVLDRAAQIDNFLQRTRLNARVQNDWTVLRGDLNTLASAYGVRWNWNNRGGITQPNAPVVGQRPYRMTDTQVEQVIRRVETRADTFRTSLDAALDRGRLDGSRQEDNINEFIRDFENATDQLRTRFNARGSVAADVEAVLSRASSIDAFMRRNTLTRRAQNTWALLRTDLSSLADAYSVAWNWNNQNAPMTGGGNNNSNTGRGGYDAQLTGTYRLDATRSDNPRDVADRATRNLPSGERQRIYDTLLQRLESPDMLAIERRGNIVTIASSRAPQTNFEVNGREQTEQLGNGRVARVSASFSGDQLIVSSTGNRANDFTVTFDPLDDGRQMQVTRRIFSDRVTQPVVVQNLYNRTADVAQWNIYDGSRPSIDNNQSASGDFIVRSGETLVATLTTDVSTKVAKDGDRFAMTVRSPAAYDRAVIEGTISNVSRSGRISGRSGLTFNFDTIRLSNGQSYRFAGIVDNLRTMSGETVKVDNEGAVEDNNQTERTVQRAAIGTAVGAIIGAIAGGGKGAAIGAVLGGAGGAGSVYVQGRDDLELLSGTEVTIRASGPNR